MPSSRTSTRSSTAMGASGGRSSTRSFAGARRRSTTSRISLVLSAEPKSYVAGFGAFSQGDVSGWCVTFAGATDRAARAAERLAAEIESRQEAWLERLGQPRSDAAVRQLVSALPEQPVIDVAAGRRLTGKSHVAVQAALKQLEEAGILSPLSGRRQGRAWECRELFDLVEEFERGISAG